eukprot:gene516-8029_t
MQRIFFTVCCLLFISAFAEYEKFGGSKVLQFNVTNEEQLKDLLKFEEENKVDFWTDNVGLAAVDVRIPLQYKEEFYSKFLQKHNIKFNVLIEDVQVLLEREISEMKNRIPYDPSNKQSEDEFFKKFHTLEEINKWIKNRAQTSNGLAKVVSLGQSYEKRDMVGLVITGKKTPTKKPDIMYSGAIHSREWASVSTVMWIANELISRYNEPKIKAIVDGIKWHIFPVINPDGYVYTHKINRLWRKTRKPNANSSCYGSDPNRNFEYKWNTGGTSNSPCSDLFHGEKPFSEVETANIAKYGMKLKNLKVYIDYHAYSQLYMRPYGWTRNAPADEAKLKNMGDKVAAEISKTHGKRYTSGRISIIIYVASGSSADHFYHHKKAYAYGIEVRPDRSARNGFILPPDQIIPCGQENMAGVILQGEMILAEEENNKSESK